MVVQDEWEWRGEGRWRMQRTARGTAERIFAKGR